MLNFYRRQLAIENDDEQYKITPSKIYDWAIFVEIILYLIILKKIKQRSNARSIKMVCWRMLKLYIYTFTLIRADNIN